MEYHSLKHKENLLKLVHDTMYNVKNQREVNDELYHNLYLYLLELFSELDDQQVQVNILAIKKYMEALLGNTVRVEIYLGNNLYSMLYGEDLDTQLDLSQIETEIDLNELYNHSTTKMFDINSIIGDLPTSTGLMELSDIKRKGTDYSTYKGLAVWVMKPLLQLTPGYVVFLMDGKRHFTPTEKEVINVFMTMIQPVINSKISLERVFEESKIAKEQSHTDGLTRIANRAKFNEDYMYNTSETALKRTLVYIDLCKLKSINDVHGHHIADGVLVEFARQMKEYATVYDGEAYRLGGDEFVILLPHTLRNEDIEKGITSFQSNYHKTVFTNDSGEDFTTQASIGVFENRRAMYTKEQVLKKADELMYISKQDRDTYPIQYSWKPLT